MNLGLLGAINGLGQGMTAVGTNIVKQQDEQAKEDRSLILAQHLQEDRFKIEDARAKRLAGEVATEASNIASTRATGLLGASRQAYADAGMADDPAVVQGLATAQAEQSVPTLRDRVQAKANLGQGSEMDLLKLDAEDRRNKIAEDANTNTNRRLDIQDRQVTQRDTRDQSYRDIQDERNRILEMKAGAKGATEDRVAAHQFIGSLGKEIDAIRDDVKIKNKALASVLTPAEDKAALKEEIEALTRRRSQLEKGRIDYAREAGIKIPAVLDTPTTPSNPAAAAKSPYAEGTRLKGPGGKTFVVRNGMPVSE